MLIGIDPDYSEEVTILGGTFRLRPVPSGKWDRLRQEGIESYRRATTRAIAALASEGKDPDEVIVPDLKLTRVASRAFDDPAYLEESTANQLEVLRWALIGHSGIQTRDGKDIAFKSEPAKFDGETFEVVSRETLKFYRANRRLSTLVYGEAFRISDLMPEEKKD